MSTAQTLVLGAIAGFTIFLGLPIGRMQNVTAATKAFLASIATGILIFLFWDVMSEAVEPSRRRSRTAGSAASPGSRSSSPPASPSA